MVRRAASIKGIIACARANQHSAKTGWLLWRQKRKSPGLSGIPKAALAFHSNPMRPLWYCAVGSATPDGNFPLCCQTGGGGSKLHILNYSLSEDLIAYCMLLLMAFRTVAAAVTTVAQQQQQTDQEKRGKVIHTPATDRGGSRTAYRVPFSTSLLRCNLFLSLLSAGSADYSHHYPLSAGPHTVLKTKLVSPEAAPVQAS